MPSLGKATFKGASGKAYRFRVFALGTRFRNRSGGPATRMAGPDMSSSTSVRPKISRSLLRSIARRTLSGSTAGIVSACCRMSRKSPDSRRRRIWLPRFIQCATTESIETAWRIHGAREKHVRKAASRNEEKAEGGGETGSPPEEKRGRNRRRRRGRCQSFCRPAGAWPVVSAPAVGLTTHGGADRDVGQRFSLQPLVFSASFGEEHDL